ncbi:hypothetical protein QTO34_002414 [Cnephaeus nilssonii]|uniref:Retroviral envelope protein GP41-like domain-containing protein n=1 Tax=Cnephaeus nilssonii TaxID=3371016 RepID=A0AA40HUW9_CNENI|nr:hypothetical protein QTO34_002414 [Eptesicus nilssonii]
MVKEQGVQVTPSNLFLAMMALVSCQVSMAAAETYWTYVPDPPVINPATWTRQSVPVFTNNTNMVGHPPLPSCPNSTTTELGAFPQWQDCANPVPVRHNISGSDLYVLDWSHRLHAKYPFHEPMSPGGFVGNALTTKTGNLQKDLWRLAAALDFNFTGSFLANTKGACTSSPCYGLLACVQPPYVLVTGNVNITRLDTHYAVQCHYCNLTSCVSRHNLNEDILILKQPSFIMLPTNITGKWYHDAGLQALQELHNQLSREKRALGLIIFGIVTLITVIASAVTASLALTQSIQNAKFVNELAQNTSTTFHDQEDIDKRLETKLKCFEAVAIGLGNQLESIKIRRQLQCHAAFTYICVTSAPYNSSLWDWNKIKMHLQGIWHHNNISIDLVRLHKHVQAIQNSHDEIISPAKLAKELLDDLKEFNPWDISPLSEPLLYKGIDNQVVTSFQGQQEKGLFLQSSSGEFTNKPHANTDLAISYQGTTNTSRFKADP